MSIPLETLSSVASIFNGKTPAKADQRIEGHPVLKIKDVLEDGFFKGTFQSFVDNCFVKKFDNKKIIVGDSLILNAAHNSDYVGSKIYKAEPSVEGALATGEWTLVRSHEKELDADYLYYWLLNGRTRHHIRQIVKGIHLYPKDVSRLKIPLPPLEEQKRIAAILDKADAIRRKRKEAIALTEELLRSTFIDMFGDPVTNPKGWNKVKLDEIVTNIDSGWSPKCDSRETGSDEWGMLKLGAVTWGHFNPSENKALLPETKPRPELEVKVGDLLFSRKNTYELVGATAYVHSTRPKLLLPDLIFRLCLSEIVDPVYLWQALSRKTMRNELSRLASGSSGSMPNISKARLKKLLVPLPALELQLKYRRIVEQFWSYKAYQQQNNLCIDNLFNSLLQKAFRGEL